MVLLDSKTEGEIHYFVNIPCLICLCIRVWLHFSLGPLQLPPTSVEAPPTSAEAPPTQCSAHLPKASPLPPGPLPLLTYPDSSWTFIIVLPTPNFTAIFWQLIF